MGKSVKTIMILGIVALLMMMVMYLLLVQSSPQVKETFALSSMIEAVFDLDKAIITIDYTEKGLRYRVTCRSQKAPGKNQLKSIGNYVWNNYLPNQKPEQVVVIYRKYEVGCIYREQVYREKVTPPAKKKNIYRRRQPAKSITHE